MVKWEVRGSAPAGMMEYWSIEEIGPEILENLVTPHLGLTIKPVMNHVFLKNPLFHYSIIPFNYIQK